MRSELQHSTGYGRTVQNTGSAPPIQNAHTRTRARSERDRQTYRQTKTETEREWIKTLRRNSVDNIGRLFFPLPPPYIQVFLQSNAIGEKNTPTDSNGKLRGKR